MPQNALPFNPAVNPSGVTKPLHVDANGNLLTSNAPSGATALNNSAGTTGLQVKTGAGVLGSVTVNTAGTTTTLTMYDGTSTSGTKLATMTTTAQGTVTYNVKFTTGLFIVATVASAADITIGYY